MPARVAILMAVYHRERPDFFAESLESVLCQTYKDIGVHLYEDGILNEALDCVVSDYCGRFKNLHVYRNASQRGLAVCLNELITLLRDKYLYFARMDSDDVSFPDRIEKQVRFMEANPHVDVLGGTIVDMDTQGKVLKQVSYPTTHDEVLQFFKKRNPIAHVTAMYRKSYFDKAGLYPPIRLEDGLYWMQGFLGGCIFHNIPEPLVYVRRTDNFLKRRSGFRMCWEELRIKMKINRNLRLGFTSNLYAVGMFGIQLLPVPVKKFLYNRLR